MTRTEQPRATEVPQAVRANSLDAILDALRESFERDLERGARV